MPCSRKRRHEKSDYYELKKHLKKMVKRRSSRARSRRRHRYDTSSSQESGHDRDRSISPHEVRDRESQRSARHGRSPHGRSRSRRRRRSRSRRRRRSRTRSRSRSRSRTRSRRRRRMQSRSRDPSRKRRLSSTYWSPYASETEDVTKLSSEVEHTTDKADAGAEASATPTCLSIKLTAAAANKNTIPTGSTAAPDDDAGPSIAATDAVASGSAAPGDTSAADPVVAEEELDSAILEIFGEDPTQTKTYGNDIQKDLAVRLEHVAINGLSKDTRKELKEKYLVPSNCKLIDAPALNPEIKVAVSEAVSKRDKAIEARQKQVACVISCLSQAMTRVVSAKEKDTDLIKLLMHAGQLLCDAQHSDSATRRNFVLTSVKKDMKEQLENTKPENLLFGQDLSETLKTAKAINKSGAELKVPTAPKSVIKKPVPGPSRALNSRGPPARRPAGPPRTKEPAPPQRSQHSKYSRPSQRRHQTFRR